MRAIVIGASVAGLLAARALSDHTESVTLLDRDLPPDSPAPRKGVPQGRHVHGVLAGGFDALKSFFPGIVEDLTAQGSRLSDVGHDILWFGNGSWRLRDKIGVVGCVQTRPLLELHIRRRVSALKNVQQRCGVAVTGLELDAAKSRVIGVRVTEGAGPEEILDADLVLDCSGRGSHTPAWLEAAGFGKVPTTTVTVNVGYSTRFFRLSDATAAPWHAMLILNTPPNGTRLGAGFFVENGELLLTLGGLFRDYPPENDAGFLKFAESLEHPGLFHAIRNAAPSSPISTYRFPAHVWHHYDQMKNLPSNLLVLGDALCSFNPIYGQGMTVAALEAQVLHRCLASNGAANGTSLRSRYFRGALPIVKAAWAMATGADLAYPQAEGKRPPGQGAILRYLGNIMALSCYDRKALTVWNQVTNMQRPFSALFAPSLAARVLRRSIAGGPPPNSALPTVAS